MKAGIVALVKFIFGKLPMPCWYAIGFAIAVAIVLLAVAVLYWGKIPTIEKIDEKEPVAKPAAIETW